MVIDIDMVLKSPAFEDSPPPPYRPRGRGTQRRAFKSTFKGFDVGSDGDEEEEELVISQPQPSVPVEESQSMFMTQPDEVTSQVQEQQPSALAAARSQRKRPAPLPDRNIMEELAPTALRIKRMRLEGREDALPTMGAPAPPSLDSEPEPEPAQKKGKGKGTGKTAMGRGKGKKKTTEDSGDELLDQFITAAQQEEAQRQQEMELLRRQLLEGDIDLGEIRKATTVQPMPIRSRNGQIEQPDEQNRWDPRWNGLRNFKKFRKQTDEESGGARAQPRKITSVQPIKPKEYGLRDEYWLNSSSNQDRGKKARHIQSQSATQGRSLPRPSSRGKATVPIELGSNSDDEEEGASGVEENDYNSSLSGVMDLEAVEPSRSRKGKASSRAARMGPPEQTQTNMETQAQTRTRVSTQGKRTAPGPPTAAPEKPAKRRATRAARTALPDSDEDEDSEGGGMTFRFGARK